MEIDTQLESSPSMIDEPYGTTLAQRARQYALTIMAQHTFEEAKKQKLICNLQDEQNGNLLLQGVALRICKGEYAFFPQDRAEIYPWIDSLRVFNVGASITMATIVTRGIVDMIPPDVLEVAISHSSRIQVLKTPSDLSNAKRAQGAAFIVSEKCVVIWADDPEKLLHDAQVMHELLTTFLWQIAGNSSGMERNNNVGTQQQLSPQASTFDLHNNNWQNNSPALSSSDGGSSFRFPTQGNNNTFSIFNTRGQLLVDKNLLYDEKQQEKDMEEALDEDYEQRLTVPISAVCHGCAFAMSLILSVLQVRQAFIWSLLDGQWSRMALLVVCPFYFIIVMFFCDTIFTIICMILGPIRQFSTNSRYYSGNKPKPLRVGDALPHITIQMPVYKEDFEFVLKPSFESIKRSIRTYELQGGSASIIVSEDGMVLLDESEKQKRLHYYEENNMTWVGRPKHGKDGFIREGRFKKASNLNFTYDVLLKTEDLIAEKKRFGVRNDQMMTDKQLYNACLQEVCADIHPDACGFVSDTFGDYILMVDSDTRLPIDCFLDAATEMTRSKDVGILQHCSGVMIVSTSFFERCIGFFTTIVNFAISYAIANGDMAPFMGHNAYLRWSAMKEIAHVETLANGKTSLKIWSEAHVSEDFVMALEMIERGYTIRWATYSNSEYMEGVSLSCDDELNRWQKYAWGVSEMVFQPINQWHRKGPFTPLIIRFLKGGAPIHYKWSSMSYCFSYYAISLAFPLTILLTILQGWLGRQVDAPFTTSFQILIVCLVVFSALGSISLCIARFRAHQGNFYKFTLDYTIYLPFLCVFFSGLSYHVSTALLSHLLGINMTWGATLKDIEMSNFFIEAPLIFKRHYRLFFLALVFMVAIFLFATNILPVEWRIHGITVLFPAFFIYGMHILFPIVLNPNMIRFSF